MKKKRRDVSLRQIEVFARIYEAKSFSRAAKSLGISQPTASSHLLGLEQELGVELFRRLGRSIEPTTAGDTLYRQASRLLLLKEEAVASVAGEGGLRGDLVVGASNIPATYLLPPRIAAFRRRHPAVHVVIRVSDSRGVTEAVESGAVHLGFIGSEASERRFEVRPFGADKLVLITRPGDPLARNLIAAERLRGRVLVLREQGSGTRLAAEVALAGKGLHVPGDFEIAAEVGSNEAAREAVRAGLGLSFVSELSVKEDLERGVLARIRVRDLDLTRRFFSICCRDRRPPAPALAFLEETKSTRPSRR